jgi:hypothetical protein
MVSDLYIGIAQEAMNKINLGDVIEAEIENNLVAYKVLKKNTYALTLEGRTNHILCPINWTTIYKEIEAMRMPAETVTTGPTRPRGRPRKGEAATGPQAPVSQPTPPPAAQTGAPPGGWLPPGKSPAELIAQAAQPAHTATVEQAGEDDAWIVKTIDDALQQLRADLLTMAQTIIEDQPEPETLQIERIMTCGNCEHVNFAANLCDFYKQTPPIKIIVNAKVNCPAFTFDDVPF